MEERQDRANRKFNKWMTLIAATAMAVVMIFSYLYATDEFQMKEYAPDDIHESKDTKIA